MMLWLIWLTIIVLVPVGVGVHVWRKTHHSAEGKIKLCVSHMKAPMQAHMLLASYLIENRLMS
jgi:hypothetical protein